MYKVKTAGSMSRALGLAELIQVGFAIVALLLTGAVPSFAQTSQLSGYVRDIDGRGLPGATVSVTNERTGVSRKVRANDDGLYSVASLFPGTYTVQAETGAAGFAPATVSGVLIDVAQNGRLDLTLEIATIQSDVVVEGRAGVVPNRDGSVGTVIDRQLIDNLPMSGRTFQTLIALTPGVNLTAGTVQNPGQFSVNGQRTSTNQFTSDGVSANFGVTSNSANYSGFAGANPALTTTGGTNGLVSVDALEQFKVQTSSYAPEFGRTPGGQVQIVTRSGTNRLTGSLSEYFRDDAFDANDWFANASNIPKAKLSQHNFGGVLGGPLLRNRLFYFASYEGLRLQQPTTAVGVVPSLALRQSAAASIRPLLDGFPLPNGPDLVDGTTGQPTGTARYTSSHSDKVRLNATSIRVDHQATSRLFVFGRYNESPSSSTTRVGASSRRDVGSQDLRTATAAANVIVGSRWLNELRVNFSEQAAHTVAGIDDHDGAIVPALGVLYPDSAFPETDTIGVQVGPASSRGSYFVGPTANNRQRQIQIVDSMNATIGNHMVKVGGDYRMSSPTRAPAELAISMIFSSPADIRNGLVTSMNNGFNAPNRPVFHNASLFAQDTWAVSPRLSVTYGVRWDLNPPASIPDNDAPLPLIGLEDPSTYALAPRGTAVYETDYTNIAPRLGFAYRLRETMGWGTTLRAGGGLFYDLGNNDVARAYMGYPFKVDVGISATPFPLQGLAAQRPTLPTTFNPPYNGSFTAFPDDFVTPRTWQWNATVEQEAGEGALATISYVGSKGEHLLRQESRSRPTPSFNGSVTIIRSDANSNYHALQAQYSRRLSNGLQVYSAYTWSKAIDEQSDTLSFVLLRGPANFDLRHVMSAAVTYMLPSPSSRVLGAAFGGWSISGLGRWQSAPPVTITANTTQTIDGMLLDQRPNLLPGVPIYIEDPGLPGGRALNAATDPARPGCVGAFCRPAAGVQGDLGRNSVRGFPASQIDLSLRRSVRFTERTQVSLAIEAFNVLNHPNFGLPTGSMSSGQFGRPTQMLGRSLGGLSPLYQIGGPRSMQLSARLAF
jgi:hypothetical protein